MAPVGSHHTSKESSPIAMETHAAYLALPLPFILAESTKFNIPTDPDLFPPYHPLSPAITHSFQ